MEFDFAVVEEVGLGAMLHFSIDQINQLIGAMANYSSCVQTQDEFGKYYQFKHDDKVVEFIWPLQNREEIWIALLKSNECMLSMFEESATAAGQEEIITLFVEVSKRFLEGKTRFVRKWKFFGPWRLEYFENGTWSWIYSFTERPADTLPMKSL